MPRLSSYRNRERGSAMVVVFVVLSALAITGATIVKLQLLETRSTGLTKLSRDSLYCAESGLVVARAFVAIQQSSWNDILTGDESLFPQGYPVTGDIDTPPDGVPDFEVTIQDNADEGDQPDDPTQDSDMSVFMVSRCTKYDDTPTELVELVRYENVGSSYRDMAGFSQTGSGNRN